MGKSALIFGASGVSGWSFINELLNDYPKKSVWTKVHALTNRPLKQEDSFWPQDPRLNIVSGIDLLQGTQDELEVRMKKEIKGVEEITHVYYVAYKASTDLDQELKDAVDMFRRSTTAMDKLSPKLEFVVLQTGAKMYGCHLLENRPSDYMTLPLHESLPRLKGAYGEALFYHPQLDWITEYAKDKRWSWCDTRPDIIIGFVPNQNFYSLATSLGVYLALYAAVKGKGSACPYPGTQKAYVAKSNDSCSDMIARQTIYLSLSPNTKKGEGYNVADAKKPESWATKWPIICSMFGLKGEGPPTNKEPLEVRTYIKENIATWHKLETEHGLKKNIADSDKTVKGSEYFLLTQFDFDRQYDMTKIYAAGFEEERDIQRTWGDVISRMRKAKIIP